MISAVPRDRADLAIAAMRRGKDVMVDKPGVTTAAQLAAVQAAVAETGRFWSVALGRLASPAQLKRCASCGRANWGGWCRPRRSRRTG